MSILGWIVVIFFAIIFIVNLIENLKKTPEQREREKEEREERKRQEIIDARERNQRYLQKEKDEQGFRRDRLSGRSGQFMTHEAKKYYLKSSQWSSLRKQVHARDHRCVTCGSKNNLNVHHIHYMRLGKEQLSDLALLCESCHHELHEQKGYSRQGLYLPDNYATYSVPTHEELRQR
jgi:5-methylcytosine-specific restriction endonuclease McrA